jgi:asparagine synthase (glutamine-hydrolysing)
MCGFVGIFGELKVDNYIPQLRKSVNLIRHRGPDGKGFFIKKNYGVAFARLSIQDLTKKGSQPMTDENNQFIIVFNGEIYNFKKLRKNLEKIGMFFKSNSDTEVLLKLYQTKKEKI